MAAEAVGWIWRAKGWEAEGWCYRMMRYGTRKVTFGGDRTLFGRSAHRLLLMKCTFDDLSLVPGLLSYVAIVLYGSLAVPQLLEGPMLNLNSLRIFCILFGVLALSLV